MVLKLLFLGGYGQFVWPAFIFTFATCLMLYVKTSKALQNQEKKFFNEYKKVHTVSNKPIEEKKITRKALSGSSI